MSVNCEGIFTNYCNTFLDRTKPTRLLACFPPIFGHSSIGWHPTIPVNDAPSTHTLHTEMRSPLQMFACSAYAHMFAPEAEERQSLSIQSAPANIPEISARCGGPIICVLFAEHHDGNICSLCCRSRHKFTQHNHNAVECRRHVVQQTNIHRQLPPLGLRSHVTRSPRPHGVCRNQRSGSALRELRGPASHASLRTECCSHLRRAVSIA